MTEVLTFHLIFKGAARHQCASLVEECERMFVMAGGNHEWLESIENVPPKLRKLFALSKLLAHQPWLINAEVIKVSKVEMSRAQPEHA